MDKKEKESYMTQAYNKLRGRLVRGLSRSNATMCLIDFLSSKEIAAITDRQLNTISRLKTGKARPTIDDAEELYAFYKLASESGLPADNDNDGKKIEDYPLYTQSDTNVMLANIQSAQEQVELILKQLSRDLATRQRTVVDFAPKYPINAEELDDGSVKLTSADPNDESQPIILSKPEKTDKAEDNKGSAKRSRENGSNEKSGVVKTDDKQSENSQSQKVSTQKQQDNQSNQGSGRTNVPDVKTNKAKKRMIPDDATRLRLYRSKNRAGESVWSTDGKSWYLAPKNGESYLKQAIGCVGKYAPMYTYLTMRQRDLLEFTTLMHEKAYRKEIPENEMNAYRKLFTDPESFWALYFKYAQHDMVNLRDDYGENVKMLEPHFTTVDDVIKWEHSLDQYLKENPNKFKNRKILDHSPENVGM